MNIVQTYCDKCESHVKDVGRLTNVKWSGVTLKVCKDCRRQLKMTYR